MKGLNPAVVLRLGLVAALSQSQPFPSDVLKTSAVVDPSYILKHGINAALSETSTRAQRRREVKQTKAVVKRNLKASKRSVAVNRSLSGLALLGTNTYLENQVHSESTLELYTDAVEDFEDWRLYNGRKGRTTAAADIGLCDFLNCLFKDGYGVDSARRVIYGYNHLRLHVSKPLLVLPRTAKALKGFEKKAPGSQRSGVMFEAATRIAEEPISMGEPKAAAAVILEFDMYLRPSELLGIRGMDLYSPSTSRHTKHWAIQIAPSDEGIPTKVGEVDTAILLDSSSRAEASMAARYLKLHCRSPRDRAVGLTLPQFEKLVKKAAAAVGLSQLNVTPHKFRHGGASSDALAQKRSWSQIQKRGRWAAVSSLKRYEKSGTMLREWLQIPLDTRRRCDRSIRAVRSFFGP